jgi:hypothetical protein
VPGRALSAGQLSAASPPGYRESVKVPTGGARQPPAARSGPATASLKDLDISRPWAVRTAWIGLAVAVLLIVIASIVYKPLDFSVYRWGGQEVTHGLRLYLTRFIEGHNLEWFTYPPFSAILFVPVAAVPAVLGQVGWQLLSIVALASASVSTLKLAGYRPSRTVIAAVVVGSITLEPMYHTLYLGQINIILLALILFDVWRAARGRPAGIGVGLATAIKLTPLIFIALFLIGRRTKDAVIAAATFIACGLIGYLVAPKASGLYWHHLFFDTNRVGATYISNQSPYAIVLRVAGANAHIGHWYLVIPALLGIIGLAAAAVLARHNDWLGAATVTGTTGLLVSPISWTHHWVWILPALVILVQGGKRSRIAAGCAYVLFVVAPMWFTPRRGGPEEYGFHWLVTLVANCYLIAGLAFLGYMAWRAYVIRGGGTSAHTATVSTTPAATEHGAGRNAAGAARRTGAAGGASAPGSNPVRDV